MNRPYTPAYAGPASRSERDRCRAGMTNYDTVSGEKWKGGRVNFHSAMRNFSRRALFDKIGKLGYF